MIKRTILALALFAGLLSPANSAGTIGFSLTQRFDKVTAKPLNGGKLYFIQAGTTSTPQNAFQDSALTIPWANPYTLDAGGNIPQLFFADGQIKIRLTNSAGVEQIVADNILVIGASSGGGGGGTVDPTTILQTGDIKQRWGTGVLAGFVRQNGRTIGSSTSGATERANSDCQPLFEYLWSADPNLAVSTGRGVSANADWVSNKTLALPDGRAKALIGIDDMGAGDGGNLSGVTAVSGNAFTLGARYGVATQAIQSGQLPVTSFSFSGTANQSVTVKTTTSRVVQGDGVSSASLGSTGTGTVSGNNFAANFVDSTGLFTASGGIVVNGGGNTFGSGQAMPLMQPSLLVTTYMKL